MLEMSMDVLKALNSGESGPTQIMYKANLSWVALRELLEGFVEKGIATESKYGGGRSKYCITQRGREILHTYQEIAGRFEIFPDSPSEAPVVAS